MALYTTTTHANLLPGVWVEKVFIPELRARLQIQPLARESTLTDNQGLVCRWVTLANPTADTATITEGGDPSGDTSVAVTAYTATMAEYGGYSDFTKVLVRTAINGTLEGIVRALAYKAALSIDTVLLATLAGGSPTTVNNGTGMTADGLGAVAAVLNNSTHATGTPGAPAMPHPKSPGGAYYVGVFSAEALYDMIREGSPTWSQAKNSQIEDNLRTPLQDTPASSALYGIMCKISDNIQRDAAQAPDDDRNFVFGADGFGASAVATNLSKPEVRVLSPDERVDLILRNRGRAAYWLLFGNTRLDQTRYVLVLTDATGIG
jgi:hypothetical protein